MANILKFTAEKKRQFLKLLRAGNTLLAASEALRISYWTVRLHRAKDRRFDSSVRAAMKAQTQTVEDALYQAAIQGNVPAMIFFLVNRTKFRKPEDRWQHVQHVRHGGDPEAPPIRTENRTQINWSKATVEELRQLQAIQQRLRTEGSEGNGASGRAEENRRSRDGRPR